MSGQSITNFGSYEVAHLLGSGSFADVFLCYHPGLETKVAVKVLHPHLSRDEAVRERFLQEAQLLWRADSDRVIQVTHVDQLADGRPYFVMRFADRGSLDQLIQDRISNEGALFTLRETVGLAVDLVDCLSAIKDRDLVHRDLKPMNILVKTLRRPDHRRAERFGLPSVERLVLADFGLAKRLQEGTNFASQLGGTPAYMAPELASLTAEVTWRADLFAMAVIVYELATGAVPWPARSLAHVTQIDLDAVSVTEWRPDLPAAMDDVLRRGLAPDPMDRHDSPEEFANELMGLLNEGDPVPAPNAISTVRLSSALDDIARSPLSDADGALVSRAKARLAEPLRLGLVGGNRLSPIPLGLKLVGERPPPGEASLLGSVIVQLSHGDAGLTALLPDGSRLDGSWDKDDDGYLRLDLPIAAWSIEALQLSFPHPDMEGLEIIDVPHAALRRNSDRVAELYESLDLVAVGLPADHAAESAAIDQVLDLGRGLGPFAVMGVRQLGISAGSEHPVIIGTVPADDTVEFRVLLDELTSGTRRSDISASAAWSLLASSPALLEKLEEVRLLHPEVEELARLRTDLQRASTDDDTRRRLHRVLGRQMAAARLGVVADAPLEALLAHATDERRAWARTSASSADLGALVSRSLERLESRLRGRLGGAASSRLRSR